MIDRTAWTTRISRLLGTLSGLCCLGIGLGAEPALKLATQTRRPIAAALLAGDTRLIVANQRSGTLSLIDCDQKRVIGEFSVGEHLAHVVALPGGKRALVTDDKRH